MREPSTTFLQWNVTTPELQRLVVLTIAQLFKTKRHDTICRILDLANPAFALIDDGVTQRIRIHADSLSVLNLLIKNYLSK